MNMLSEEIHFSYRRKKKKKRLDLFFVTYGAKQKSKF